MVIVAGANALAHARRCGGPALAGLPRAVEFDQQGLRRRLGVAMHRVLDRHLIAELRHIDIDLRDHGARRDQLAFLRRPLRKACAESRE